MIKKHLFICVLLFVFGFTGVAGATRICTLPGCPPNSDYNIWYDIDSIDKPLESGVSVSYELDIRSQYDPLNDTIQSAFMGFLVGGQTGPDAKDKWFMANWTYDSVGSEWRFGHAPADGWTVKLGILRDDPLDMLRSEGILQGDFTAYFCGTGELTLKKAFLLAKGCDTNPVPEPATMLLLGSGLVVIAGFGRKKFNNKDNQ